MRTTVLPLIFSCLALAACSANEAAENTMNVEDTLVAENVGDAEIPNTADTIFCDVVQERVSRTDCDDLKALESNVRPGAAALNVPDPMVRGRKYPVSLYVDLRGLDEIEQLDAEADANLMEENATADINALEMDANAVADVAENAAADVNAADTVDANAVDNVVANADAAVNADMTAPPPRQYRRMAAPTPTARAEAEEGRDVAFVAEVARRMRATLSGQGFDIRAISPADGVITISASGSGRWEWEVVPQQGGNRTLTVRTEAVGRVGNRDIVIGDSTTSKSVQIRVSPADRIRDFLTETPVWLKLLTGVLIAAAALLGAWFGLKKVWKKGDA